MKSGGRRSGVITEVKLFEFAVVPFGGVFQVGPPVEDPFKAAIRRAAPRAAVVRAPYGPEIGAVLLALDALGSRATPEVIGNLAQSGRP